MLGVASIQQGEELDLYMQGTESAVGERKLSLIVHYEQEEQIPQTALIALIRGFIAQMQVRSCVHDGKLCTGKNLYSKSLNKQA